MKEHIRPPNPDDPADELDADGPQSSNKPDADEGETTGNHVCKHKLRLSQVLALQSFGLT